MHGSPIKISFEFFPPKSDEGMKALQETANQLRTAQPEFFSVTFGAGGSTRSGTYDTVQKLITTGIPIAPHLAAVGLKRTEMIEILKSYQALGIKRVVALRGDLPSGMGGQSGELKYAYELVQLIREATGDFFQIEVAAYPECHPQAENVDKDIDNLMKKMQAGANSAITQYFYNPDAYFFFRDACQKKGMSLSIIPGIMPITNFSKLARFSDMCGAEIPRWIRRRLEALGDDTQAVQAFGLDVVHMLCERLIAGGAPGLHFYTLNHAEPSLALCQRSKETESAWVNKRLRLG